MLATHMLGSAMTKPAAVVFIAMPKPSATSAGLTPELECAIASNAVIKPIMVPSKPVIGAALAIN